MAAPPLSNTFEGGTNGVTISSGNSGGASGDAFDNSLNNSPVFSTDNAFSGTFSAKVSGVADGSRTINRWNSLGNLTIPIYVRFYLYASRYPDVSGGFVYVFSPEQNPGTAFSFIWFDSSGRLGMDGITGNTANGTSSMPLNQWNRIEAKYLAGTSGSGEWRLYTDPNSNVITETRSGVGSLGTGFDSCWFGNGLQPSLSSDLVLYHDNVAISTTGWLGAGAYSFAKEVPARSFGPF